MTQLEAFVGRMALWDETTPCAVCGEPAGDLEVLAFDFVGNWREGPYPGFSDGVAHRACLASWARKHDFVRYWNLTMKANGLRKRLVANERGEVAYERILSWDDHLLQSLEEIARRLARVYRSAIGSRRI